MSFETAIIGALQNHFILASFLGSLILGNAFILFLAALAGRGEVSLLGLWILAFLAAAASDIAWHLLARKGIAHLPKKKWMQRMTFNPSLATYMASKFMYGTRIMFLIYTGIKKVPLTRFALYSSISAITWTTTLIALGWFAGRGSLYLSNLTHTVRVALTLTIILGGALYLFRRFLSNVRRHTKAAKVQKRKKSLS